MDLSPYMVMVRRIAYDVHNFHNPVIEYRDLVNVGYLGLMDAAKRYDPEKAKFETYAPRRIRGAMLDEIRRVNHTERVGPQPKIYSLDEWRTDPRGLVFDPPDESVDLFESAASSEIKHKLRRTIAYLLTDIERQVIFMYFYQNLNNRQIGERIGRNESRAAQIRLKAIKKLRGVMSDERG